MSLVLTRMQNMRNNDAKLDKFETRPSEFGALDLFQNQSMNPNGILSPTLIDQASKSIGRVLESPVIDYDQNVSISNVRSVTVPDSDNVSKMIQYTFITYSWGFTLVPSDNMNNEISVQREFDQNMKKFIIAFGKLVDTQCITAMEAAKTKIYNDLLGLYTEYADTIVSEYALREELLGDLEPIMSANDFNNTLHIVGNQGTKSLVNKLGEHKTYNDVDKEYQFASKVWHYSNRVVNGVGKYATGYIVEDGSVGMLLRYERGAVLGDKNFSHEWGKIVLPLINMEVGTYFYTGVSDQSARSGSASVDNTRAIKEYYGFSVDIAYVTSYNSDPDALAAPIAKYAINTAATDADTTAPLVDSVTDGGDAKVSFTTFFDEVMCSDEAGTIVTGDIVDDLVATNGVLLSAVWAADGKSIVVTFSDTTGLVATNTVALDGITLYDANANALASGILAKVNAGNTAWEKN